MSWRIWKKNSCSTQEQAGKTILLDKLYMMYHFLIGQISTSISGSIGEGGGSDRGTSYFIPPQKTNFRICLPKKVPRVLAYPKSPTPTVNCYYVIVDLS